MMDWSKINDAVAAAIFVLAVWGIIYLYFYDYTRKRALSAKREEKEDAIAEGIGVVKMGVPDRFVFVKYRGMILPMRAHEKEHIWDNLSREGRNEQVQAMKTAVKRGKVVAIQLDSETVVYAPKSADMVKVREDYKAFKDLKGKIVEE